MPTTVLAQQHLRTFRDRFRGVPAKIEVRRLEPQVGRKHRCLSRVSEYYHRNSPPAVQDVRFKDLGLLIIDEEQRFGQPIRAVETAAAGY